MSPFPFRSIVLVVSMVVASALAANRPLPAVESAPEPQQPRLHLAWRAPYGLAGASDSVAASCADSTRNDTLYLSFEPSRDETAFVAIGGELLVHALPGDSLPAFWHVGKGGRNRGGVILQFGPAEDMPGASPWPVPGLAVVEYAVNGGTGRLRFGCTLAADSKVRLRRGERYTIGRVLVRGVSAAIPGCDAPVCLEWKSAEFVFGGGRNFRTGGVGHALAMRGAAGPLRRSLLAAAPVPTTPAVVQPADSPAPIRITLDRPETPKH